MLTSNRLALSALAVAAAVIFVIIAILYLTASAPWDPHRHIKHAILFFGLAMVAVLFAAANRRTSTGY